MPRPDRWRAGRSPGTGAYRRRRTRRRGISPEAQKGCQTVYPVARTVVIDDVHVNMLTQCVFDGLVHDIEHGNRIPFTPAIALAYCEAPRVGAAESRQRAVGMDEQRSHLPASECAQRFPDA